MSKTDNSNAPPSGAGDVLGDILAALKGERVPDSGSRKRVAQREEPRFVRKSVPYLSNPFFHELMRGRENKLGDLDREIPAHLLARIAQRKGAAPELWRRLWAERRVSEVVRSTCEERVPLAERVFISCVAGEGTAIACPEQYSPVSDWSHYIWWLFSRRPELSKISPKLPGHVLTSIASIEWRLLPAVRPDILSVFVSRVKRYKSSNPPPRGDERVSVRREYFRRLMRDLRSGLENNFSEWLLPFLRSKKIQIEGFCQNSAASGGSSGSTRGSEIIKEPMPVETIPMLVCRDVDRSLAKKKGHANLVPTHLFPHANSSDCCLQSQVYQNVYIEEYSGVSWSLVSRLPKIEIKTGVRVQFVHGQEQSDELFWVDGEIESISNETGEILLRSRLPPSGGEDPAASVSTSLLGLLPPSIPTLELRRGWWRLLPPEMTSEDLHKGSVVVYRSEASGLGLRDGVLVETPTDCGAGLRVRALADDRREEVDLTDVRNRLPFDIHPFDGDYGTADPLSSWSWCIPRPFQGESSKGSKGKFLLWLVSGEINMISEDPLLCVSIQPDIPFNHGYIWGPLPITCFTDVKTPGCEHTEQGCSLQDVDSILDTPLSLLV